MRLLDLYCGAGGAAMGYHRAGFEVVGVDIRPQPHYPFDFRLADSLAFDTDGFDAIHASPPCKVHSALSVLWGERGHLDLIPATRAKLEAASVPYVIENVMTAPVRRDVVLCGTMFGLGLADGRGHLQRHRAFELGNGWPIPLTPPCAHPASRAVGVYGHTGGKGTRSGNHGWLLADWCEAMQIDWMRRDELAQAIPPSYTELLGLASVTQIENQAFAGESNGFCSPGMVTTQTQTAA